MGTFWPITVPDGTSKIRMSKTLKSTKEIGEHDGKSEIDSGW
jgi:hypothetical protein